MTCDQRKMSSPVRATVSVFLISLLAVPMSYIVNTAHTEQGDLGLLVAGCLCLTIVLALTYIALASFRQPKDWLFYVFTLSTFSSVIDIIVGLGNDGYVSGFMTNYLIYGEPYLATPYGTVICYWDGIVHFALYLYMLTAMACRWNYRVAGLYWVGSIGHSMLVLLPGAILSKQGVRWSFCLNIPYIIIPVVAAVRFLRQRDLHPDPTSKSLQIASGWLGGLCRRPVDVMFIIAMVLSIFVAFLRGFAVLGCSNELSLRYIEQFEPYLQDPTAFPKAQMLVYLYYFVPFYVIVIYSLLVPGCHSMSDWALIFAGASGQAQTSHVVSSFHSGTPSQYHVPSDTNTVFLSINVVLLCLVPHLFALRCCLSPSFFRRPTHCTEQSSQRERKKLK